MTTLVLTVLAIGCVLAMAYAVFLRTANTALLRRLGEAEARARKAELEAGHAVDAAEIPAKPIAENVATLTEGGLLTSPSIFGSNGNKPVSMPGLSQCSRSGCVMGPGHGGEWHRDILGGYYLSVVVLLALALLSATPARAADLLPAGTAISTTAGELVFLDDEYLLVDRGEVANIAIMVRDLERCRLALEECDAAPKPPATIAPAKPRLGWWVAAITASFAAGLAVGASTSNN